MRPIFIGREQELRQLNTLIDRKQGGIFAITGAAGTGKSTLLTHIRSIYPKKAQLYINADDLSTATNACELLLTLATNCKDLPEFEQACKTVKQQYKTEAEIDAVYQHQQASDKDANLTETADSFVWLSKLLGKSAAVGLESAHNPEQYLLNALIRDCRQRPLILIDNYQHLAATHINSYYSRLHLQTLMQQDSLGLNEWLRRWLMLMQQHGATLIIAGTEVDGWQEHARMLSNFSADEISELAFKSPASNLQEAMVQNEENILRMLQGLSFNGNPLWVRIAISFLNQDLQEEYPLAESQHIGVLYQQFGQRYQQEYKNSSHTESLLAELYQQARIELEALEKKSPNKTQRTPQPLSAGKNNHPYFVLVPFLAWLNAPTDSYQPVLSAIENFDPDLKWDWDCSEMEEKAAQLAPPQQLIAQQFINYFKGQSSAAELFAQLDAN